MKKIIDKIVVKMAYIWTNDNIKKIIIGVKKDNGNNIQNNKPKT